MPAGVHVLVDGAQAEIEVPDPALRRKITARLVDAARPDAWRIEIHAVGRHVPTLIAPTAVVRKAGLLDEPPRTGKGATAEAWQAHLAGYGIAYQPDDSRRELIAAWDAWSPT